MFAFFLEPELIFSSVFRMHEAALEYGIVLKDLAVIDRQFKVKKVNYVSDSYIDRRTLSRAISPRLWTR
jgi:hypothetical protein